MPRLSIFCLTSLFCLAPVWAWSGEGRWRANPLRPVTSSPDDATATPDTPRKDESSQADIPSGPDGTPRIQLEQPPRNESADVADRDVEPQQAADPRVEQPAPQVIDRVREFTSAPSADTPAAESTVSKGQSNPNLAIHRLPSVFAPPPLARKDVGGLQFREAASPKAPASLPPASAVSMSTESESRQETLPPAQPTIVDLPPPPDESAAEKPPTLWQRFVPFPNKFKKPPREQPELEQAVAASAAPAESEQATKKGNWFSSFGQRMFKAPPPPQWMQERMARHYPAGDGDQ